MIHLDEDRVERLLHGELSAAATATAREHIADCADCRALIDRAERDENTVTELLRQVDHSVPRVTAGLVAARAAEPAGHARRRLVAGIVLTLGIAGAAYAIPGSPVRVWVQALMGTLTNQRSQPMPMSPQAEPVPSGIAVLPGPRLLIAFTSTQAAGQARVTLTDGAEVVVRATAGAATFTSEVDRLVVDNRGSAAGFEIQIPATAARVEIVVGGKRRLLKEGSRVTTEPPSSGTGPYLIPLTP